MTWSAVFCPTEEGCLSSLLSDLGAFSGKARGGVSVREGQGVVLMCIPPPHSPGEVNVNLPSWFLQESSWMFCKKLFMYINDQNMGLSSLRHIPPCFCNMQFITPHHTSPKQNVITVSQWRIVLIIYLLWCQCVSARPSVQPRRDVLTYSNSRAAAQILRDQICWIIRKRRETLRCQLLRIVIARLFNGTCRNTALCGCLPTVSSYVSHESSRLSVCSSAITPLRCTRGNVCQVLFNARFFFLFFSGCHFELHDCE